MLSTYSKVAYFIAAVNVANCMIGIVKASILNVCPDDVDPDLCKRAYIYNLSGDIAFTLLIITLSVCIRHIFFFVKKTIFFF